MLLPILIVTLDPPKRDGEIHRGRRSGLVQPKIIYHIASYFSEDVFRATTQRSKIRWQKIVLF